MHSTFSYVIKHTYGVQKDAEQSFDTYEDSVWAINYNLKIFLKNSKRFVLFISDMSLEDGILAKGHLISKANNKVFI